MSKLTIKVGDTVSALDLAKQGDEFRRGTVISINRNSPFPYTVSPTVAGNGSGIFAPGEIVKVRKLVGSVKHVLDVLTDNKNTPMSIEQIAGSVDTRRCKGLSILPGIMDNESIGARLRDLRKPVFGQYKINVIGKGRNAKYQLAA